MRFLRFPEHELIRFNELLFCRKYPRHHWGAQQLDLGCNGTNAWTGPRADAHPRAGDDDPARLRSGRVDRLRPQQILRIIQFHKSREGGVFPRPLLLFEDIGVQPLVRTKSCSSQNGFKILVGCPNGFNIEVLDQGVEHIGSHKSRQGRPEADALIPRYSSARSTHTAFCSYHDMIKESGRSFTETLNALAKADAICTAE